MSVAPIVGARRGRALLVIHYPVFGGPHNQALRLDGPLRRAGWETTVLLPAEPGNASDILKRAGLEVDRIPLSRVRALGSMRAHLRLAREFRSDVARIRRVIHDRDVDLVIVAGLVNPHAAFAARHEGVPVVWQILDTRAPHVLRLASAVLVRRLADVVMTTGSIVADLHPGIGAFFGDRVVHFFPPVDVDLFRSSPERRLQARRELGLPSDSLVVGNVGVLSPMKRHLDFVRAAGIIRRERACRFVILGACYDYRRGYTEQLLQEARSVGLEVGRDLIIRDPEGHVHELAPAFDVFWLTSAARSEGVPTVLGEAMALELPVVATDAGGTRDAVEDGVTGYVVPPGDPLALVRASRPLLDDANLRMRLGRAGRARAERLFALEPVVESHLKAFELALARRRRVAHVVHTAGDPPAETSDLLRCPSCHSRLDEKASGLHCSSCQGTYRVIDGIPVLLQGIAHATAHKRHQAAFFDKTDAEFEIERPHGTVGLYEWLIDEKFRRSVAALRGVLVGATTLTVCGGSGMDAEFLANVGARVIASDLSLEAARRTRERARRHGVAIKPIVADVERLPFADRSIDVVFVHDGLHHLENPVKGLREMARVARVAVSVNEPAHAAVTRAAIRLGLASHHEEAGNFIGRLRLDDIVSELRRAGFEIVGAERYAMYYRHAPGGVSRMLSVPAVRHAAMAGILLFNAVAGSIGNKLTVQAMRA